MGFKDEETRKAYYRNYQRQRRAEKAGKAEVKSPPASVGNVARTLNPPLSPKIPAESPSALKTPPPTTHKAPKSTDYEPKESAVAIKEEEMTNKRIDGQVHLLAGMTVLRSPSVVFEQSKRLLETKGWCIWRYPTLDNMVWVILRDEKVSGYPPNFHTLTCNPDRSLEAELKMNIPGCLN